MEDKQTTLQQTSNLKLHFFPPPTQSNVDHTLRSLRSPVQLSTLSEGVQRLPRRRDFVECDC